MDRLDAKALQVDPPKSGPAHIVRTGPKQLDGTRKLAGAVSSVAAHPDDTTVQIWMRLSMQVFEDRHLPFDGAALFMCCAAGGAGCLTD